MDGQVIGMFEMQPDLHADVLPSGAAAPARGKDTHEFRNYENSKRHDKIREFYRLNHANLALFHKVVLNTLLKARVALFCQVVFDKHPLSLRGTLSQGCFRYSVQSPRSTLSQGCFQYPPKARVALFHKVVLILTP
jgi:hypothetical protein